MHTKKIDAIDDQMAEVFRLKSGRERLAIAHGMWRSASRMIHRVVRAEHPEWSDDRINRETARRLSHGAV
jgi:hypothetical protein